MAQEEKKEVQVSLLKNVTLYATKDAPHNTLGEEILTTEVLAKKFVEKGWFTTEKPKDSKK